MNNLPLSHQCSFLTNFASNITFYFFPSRCSGILEMIVVSSLHEGKIIFLNEIKKIFKYLNSNRNLLPLYADFLFYCWQSVVFIKG